MSVAYSPVVWTPQKKKYDRIMWALILIYILFFVGFQLIFYPDTSPETLIIRMTGTLAFLMLHIVLCIGPAARLNSNFLPLLYNRRHLGVSLFLIALIHGIFNLIQFHALGDIGPIASIFSSNLQYDSLVNFPFQSLGFFGLIILFLMAVTSHDFWLKNLGPGFWKSMHMLVYLAYAILVFHVLLGAGQSENMYIWTGLISVGFVIITSLHLASAWKRIKNQHAGEVEVIDGYYQVCNIDEIEEDRAKIVWVEGEEIAIFKYNDKLSAVHNVCKHQHGPLGEGKIIDGCITCPWHGYQYLPHNGQSPPPFTEKVKTYDLKLINGVVYVNPSPNEEGTEVEPVQINV